MNEKDFEQLLSAFIDGELSEDERRELRKELSAPKIQKAIRRLQDLKRLVSESAGYPLSPLFSSRILLNIRNEKLIEEQWLPIENVAIKVVGALGAIVLLMMIVTRLNLVQPTAIDEYSVSQSDSTSMAMTFDQTELRNYDATIAALGN